MLFRSDVRPMYIIIEDALRVYLTTFPEKRGKMRQLVARGRPRVPEHMKKRRKLRIRRKHRKVEVYPRPLSVVVDPILDRLFDLPESSLGGEKFPV